MDYEIPIKIKDEYGYIQECLLKTELNDKYAYFLSNLEEFDGNIPKCSSTIKNFQYSWTLRDFRRCRDWECVFKGRQEKIKEQLKKSKTLKDFFEYFGFEWTDHTDYCFEIVHQEQNIFEEIEL